MIAVQTTGVMHKTIKIPKKVPKNGKLLFLLYLWLHLYFFIKYFNLLIYLFFLFVLKLLVALTVVSYNPHPHFIAIFAKDTAIKSVTILFGQ